MANRPMRVARPTLGRRGRMRGEEAERSIAVSAIQGRLGLMVFCCQSSSLLGCLETLGPGGVAAASWRWQAAEVQRRWQQEDQARRPGDRATGPSGLGFERMTRDLSPSRDIWIEMWYSDVFPLFELYLWPLENVSKNSLIWSKSLKSSLSWAKRLKSKS